MTMIEDLASAIRTLQFHANQHRLGGIASISFCENGVVTRIQLEAQRDFSVLVPATAEAPRATPTLLGVELRDGERPKPRPDEVIRRVG